MREFLFSIITPEHNKHNILFLTELYNTIVSQTYTNWEWVLFLNGDIKTSDIPVSITSNSKVKIFESEANNSVGYIKNKAFYKGIGDILVEADHDDLLSEDCLLELNKAFQNPEIGFVYSENLSYDMRGEQHKIPFRADHGWTYTKQTFRNELFLKMDSFPPSSQSLCFIWYAPDHVRAWRKEVYHQIGGHNESYSVCDDHELLIRTYLKTKFYFIPKVLYYYRILPDSSNTCIQRGTQIQEMTKTLFNKYAQLLAERDAELNNLSKVDIGGGLFPRAGYLTIDQEGADITCDLNEGIPLLDNSVGVLNASHILEHLKDPWKSMKEIHRVLADGGWAFIQVPSTDGRGAWQDPTHISFWNENSFLYYTTKEKAQYIRNTTIRFQEFRLDTIWWDRHVAVTNAWLCAIKSDKRRPHPINI